MARPPRRSTLFPYTRSSDLGFIGLNWRQHEFVQECTILDSAMCIMRDGSLKRSEEHTSELQSRGHLVCRLLLEKKTSSSPPRAGPGPSRRSRAPPARATAPS